MKNPESNQLIVQKGKRKVKYKSKEKIRSKPKNMSKTMKAKDKVTKEENCHYYGESSH